MVLKDVYLDELRPYALFDPAELKAGMELILVRVPPLDEHTVATLSHERPTGRLITLKSWRKVTISSVHGQEDYPGESARDLIFFSSADGADSYLELNSVGILPYPSGIYSFDSFTVSVAKLTELGLRAQLSGSERYEELYRGTIENRKLRDQDCRSHS